MALKWYLCQQVNLAFTWLNSWNIRDLVSYFIIFLGFLWCSLFSLVEFLTYKEVSFSFSNEMDLFGSPWL